MKPKCIGIVGGAGPLAGALLLERIFSLASQLYGCYRDADYPKVILISFPFTEMLFPNENFAKLQQESSDCLKQLRDNGASVLTIACNTLHAFLPPDEECSDLIHLPRSLAEAIPPSELPLVLCTSTSLRFGIHRNFFPCVYPDRETQIAIDRLIDQILKGVQKSLILKELNRLILAQQSATVILGCTELSLYSAELAVPNKQIIDPLEIVAKQVLYKSFQTNG